MQWSNENSGFIAIAIFFITLLLVWITCIFQSLRRKPKFVISVLPGPTCCCTFNPGRQYEGRETHITAFALYIQVTNVGHAPSSIKSVSIGYHNHTVKHTMLRFWLDEPTVALKDFMVKIGEDFKVYPFLTQQSILAPNQTDGYLEIGKSVNGVVYFEQPESWGGYFPRVKNENVRVKIRIEDSFGRKHARIVRVPVVDLEQASKYNSQFGQTREKLGS